MVQAVDVAVKIRVKNECWDRLLDLGWGEWRGSFRHRWTWHKLRECFLMTTMYVWVMGTHPWWTRVWVCALKTGDGHQAGSFPLMKRSQQPGAIYIPLSDHAYCTFITKTRFSERWTCKRLRAVSLVCNRTGIPQVEMCMNEATQNRFLHVVLLGFSYE